VCREGDPVPASLQGAVAAIGNFDGVHRGHQSLIAAVEEEARRLARGSAIVTFEPHPRQFFAPDRPLFRLTPEPVKFKVLARLGLDGAFVRRFDQKLAGTSATSFVEDLMIRDLGLGGVVVGDGFRFGRGREGTAALLRDLALRHGLACTVVDPVSQGSAAISSTAIRAALAEGDVSRANGFLGYRWFVRGRVRHGDKRGRTLGYPTANLALDPGCGLRHGIYAVRVAIAPGDIRGGVASFGRRPTFDNGAPLLEVFLFDFADDLYDRDLEVEFVAWIRGEERFGSADELVGRMNEDARLARAGLASPHDCPSLIG
jgi:riboflavin kinase/FMN adenylyltransferase